MPNWCNNNIKITGPNKVIDKIEKIVKDETGESGQLLNYFHPMPEGLRNTTADGSKDKAMIKKYGYSSWYDWCVDNWSTKWDVNEFYGIRRVAIPSIDGKSVLSEIHFGFDSAWAPPINAYDKFIDDNSNVSIRATYMEGGCDFMGIWDNGIDDCWTISDTAPKGSIDKFWKTSAGKELDDLYGLTENMAEYEAQQEEERIGDNKEIIDYSKGEKVNVGG